MLPQDALSFCGSQSQAGPAPQTAVPTNEGFIVATSAAAATATAAAGARPVASAKLAAATCLSKIKYDRFGWRLRGGGAAESCESAQAPRPLQVQGASGPARHVTAAGGRHRIIVAVNRSRGLTGKAHWGC